MLGIVSHILNYLLSAVAAWIVFRIVVGGEYRRRGSGILLAGAGFFLTAGTMFRFGLPRAFGWKVDRLRQAGPYRPTRKAQIVGVCVWAAGMVILWPSGYAAGLLLLLAVPAHTMVVTEEEHLSRVLCLIFRSDALHMAFLHQAE